MATAHFLFDDGVHELADFTGSIEEGVIGVAVQMDERIFRHGLPLIGRVGRYFYFTAWWPAPFRNRIGHFW